MRDEPLVLTMTKDEIDQLVESASERGANKALAKLGLEDPQAPSDIRNIRDLLAAYRVVKVEAVKTATKIITAFLLASLSLGVALKSGIIKIMGVG